LEFYPSRPARQGRFEEAKKDFNKALAINPSDTVAYLNRGMLFKRQGRYEASLADFLKAKSLGGNVSDQLIQKLRGLNKINNRK